jgi:hypothetical protein
MKVKDGELFSSEKFHLYNSEGELEEHEGLYFICDGGYHKWRMDQDMYGYIKTCDPSTILTVEG